MHYWVRASSSDFAGTIPQPRSGHTAVNIGKSKVVVFGGLVDRKFLSDIVVYDIENKIWFRPECTGSGSDGQVGPSPRAFHVSVSVDCHMFIFGGRYGGKRLGDFWVLDTDIWQWSELTSFGDLPSPRDFAAASAIGNQKIVMYGGWDGKKWLSDVYVMDTISLEWTELSVSGSLPVPRCGHSATMLEKRLLVYGGRGGSGSIMGDLWALKGLIDDENETPGWTQLKLPGQTPSPRCGHTVTSGGNYLLLFGGHGTGGWLSRYDIYHNECVVLDRVSAQWKRLPTRNEPPPARAYHTLTCIGTRYLLFGGFDGKLTYGDLWWLVPEEDPIAKRFSASPPRNLPEDRNAGMEINTDQPSLKPTDLGLGYFELNELNGPGTMLEIELPVELSFVQQESGRETLTVADLQKKLQINVSLSSLRQIVEELEDKEFIELGLRLLGNDLVDKQMAIQAVREHWRQSTPRSIPLGELEPLLRDYQRLITQNHLKQSGPGLQSVNLKFSVKEDYKFYHFKNASQLRIDDISKLLEEYQKLLLE